MRMFSGYRDCISRACAMAAFAAVVAAAAVPGWAQTYPSQPVELVVGYPQSGAGDIIARLIADRLGNVLGQPVHVENRPGASGAIAAQTVAHAAPDGHTLLAGQTPEVAIIPTLVEMPRHRWFRGIGNRQIRETPRGRVLFEILVRRMRELSAVLKVRASARFEPGRNREYHDRAAWLAAISLFHQSQGHWNDIPRQRAVPAISRPVY